MVQFETTTFLSDLRGVFGLGEISHLLFWFGSNRKVKKCRPNQLGGKVSPRCCNIDSISVFAVCNKNCLKSHCRLSHNQALLHIKRRPFENEGLLMTYLKGDRNGEEVLVMVRYFSFYAAEMQMSAPFVWFIQ